jgi:hypothetical protein
LQLLLLGYTVLLLLVILDLILYGSPPNPCLLIVQIFNELLGVFNCSDDVLA